MSMVWRKGREKKESQQASKRNRAKDENKKVTFQTAPHKEKQHVRQRRENKRRKEG